MRAVGELALARERLVGVRHVERGHALLEAAERHRPVVRDRRADAHPARELRDPLGAGLDAHLGVDRVVRGRRRLRERDHAGVGVAVVLDRELLGRAGDVEHLLARRPQRGGGDALLHRLGEHERLEGRAGLALALGGEVERRGVVVVAADHRPDLAGLVLDRHQRGARAAEVGQPGADRVVGGLLEAPVDRGLDRQAALEGLAGAGLAAAELVDHLLLDPGREVGVLRLLARRLDVAAGGERLGDALLVLLARDQALLRACGGARGRGAAWRRPGGRSGRTRSARRRRRRSARPPRGSSCAAHGRTRLVSQPVCWLPK